MRPTIAAGIVCYNEADWIEACVRGALQMADEIIITDGLYVPDKGTAEADLKLSEKAQHSTDGTYEILQKLAAEDSRITLFDAPEDTSLAVELSVRDCQLQLCASDYFLIVDADEIWTARQINDLRSIVENSPEVPNFFIRNRLYFWSPYFYVNTKHQRLFKLSAGRKFYGINEVTGNHDHLNIPQSPTDYLFHHYGYIDPEKVKFKMQQRYNEGHYRGSGMWWYNNIFMAFDGTIECAHELVKKNYGTLHPWGKIHPEYAADEFTPLFDPNPTHPAAMHQYFDKRGFDTSNITFVS